MKKMTRNQKQILSKHMLNANEWLVYKETKCKILIVNKNTNVLIALEKERKIKHEQIK